MVEVTLRHGSQGGEHVLVAVCTCCHVSAGTIVSSAVVGGHSAEAVAAQRFEPLRGCPHWTEFRTRHTAEEAWR